MSTLSTMAPSSDPSKVHIPTEAELKSLSKDDRLAQAKQASESAGWASRMVDTLRSKAALLTDPKERQRVLTEAYKRELEARGLTRKAKILSSGTLQGAAGGAGIGAATGAGLGTAVGTLVGTVASVPTTLVGGLAGAGTGAIHGPWFRLDGGDSAKGKDSGEGEKLVQVPQEAIDSGAALVDESTGQVTVKDSSALKDAPSMPAEVMSAGKKTTSTGNASEKKKPKKLEVRSKKSTPSESPTENTAKTRRKPPKIEVRSKKVE